MIVPVVLLTLLTSTISTAPITQPPEAPEKSARTPAQQKINSQLLYEIYRQRGDDQRRHTPQETTGVRIDARGRALVDIRTEPTAALQKRIAREGGVVRSTSERDRSIVARVPLLKLESLASDPAVLFVEPAAEAITNRQPDARR